MGWTSYHAIHYKHNGSIDRKAECDAYFMDGLNAGFYKVEKSCMKGSIYYAAVTAVKRFTGNDDSGKERYEPIPEEEQETFAYIILTSTDKRDYFNFSMKVMDETYGPFETDCPKSILSLLSETDSEFALEWRKKCAEKYNSEKKRLSALPVGTIISFFRGTEKVTLIKKAASYQFKRPFWMVYGKNCYCPKNHIPTEFIIEHIPG